MHRVEVRLKSHLPDARGLGLVKDIHDLGIATASKVRVVDIYWLDADLSSDELDLICRQLLADPVTQEYWYGKDLSSESGTNGYNIEVAYNAGVADPVEDTIKKAVRDLGVEGVSVVKTAKRYLIEGQLDEQQLEAICSRLLVNPIIQHVVEQDQVGFSESPQYKFRLNRLDILGSDSAGFLEIRKQFDFTDDEPFLDGWFGFRTVANHMTIDNFKVYALKNE